MDHQKNLETLSKLAAVERGAPFGGNSEHFRIIAMRIVWLQKKRLKPIPNWDGPNYCDEEIDALFWLLAQLQIDTGIDIETRLGGTKAGKTIDVKRFGEMLDYVRTCRARATPRMLAA